MSSNKTINHWMIKAKALGTSPENLWDAACEYFMWCEANPILSDEMIRQTGAMVIKETPRAFNIPALCLHIGVSIGWLQDLFKRKEAGDYHLVAQRIMQVIYAQKFEYAMAGIFNPVLSARDLNLGSADAGGKIAANVSITVITNDSYPLLESEQDLKFNSIKTASEKNENTKSESEKTAKVN